MPEKFDRCVQHVKEQGGKANPYAVCHASLGKEFTKEDQDKLGQILKGLNEMRSILKGSIKVREYGITPSSTHVGQRTGRSGMKRRRNL